MQANRNLKSHNIDYLRLGAIFAWFYSEKEKPSITNKDGFILRSAEEYFKNNHNTPRQIKSIYNAWSKDIGKAKTYALNLISKNGVNNVCLKNNKVCSFQLHVLCFNLRCCNLLLDVWCLINAVYKLTIFTEGTPKAITRLANM